MGLVYKAKIVGQDKPQVVRVVKLTNIKDYVIEGILNEIRAQKDPELLPLTGFYYKQKSQTLYIVAPQRVSLHTYLFEASQTLSPKEKSTLVLNLARCLSSIHSSQSPAAHGHLTPHNILLNPIDLSICIGDYGLRSLKKYCKLFHGYRNRSEWSAPEVWQGADGDTEADVFSFGLMMWAVETGIQPFAGKKMDEVGYMLIEQKLRPQIPPATQANDLNLAQLIRACWHEVPERRPDFSTIVKILEQGVKFTQ
ncbi:hypothetical protein FGO68_gene15796 [Halteria grandinella]|uniref:Protein kinase domain-containing protein n=1 Tax=Halteria grandinella TaxID=5974 RepID=A0A8J8T6L9_HALGN|nr:hypothetical protein FGO68_gene15796 [Halteria grandinella]